MDAATASGYCEGFENGRDSDFRLASWIKGFMFARALSAPKPYMASITSASQSVHIDLSDTPRKQEVYQGEDIEAELPSDHSAYIWGHRRRCPTPPSSDMRRLQIYQCGNATNATKELGTSAFCLLLSLLDKKDIDFIIAVVGRGEAFWTASVQQHQIVNLGYSAARSINFSHPEDERDIAKAVRCPDCVMFKPGKESGAPVVPPPQSESRRASSTGIKPKRKRQTNQGSLGAPPRKATRTGTAPQRELEEVKCMLEGLQYHPPNIDPRSLTGVEVGVYKLVASVQSTMAIQQFQQLVYHWREQQSRATLSIDSTGSALDNVMASIRLAEEVEKAKGPIQQRADLKFLHDLASRKNMTKEEVKRHLRDGKQWSKLCESVGLLAFIPLDSNNAFGIKKEEWIELSLERRTASMKAFPNLLNNGYMKNILVAGKVLVEMVSGTPVVFSWEKDRLS
ncbi:uncharacterized protein FIESC28_00654 [Fusarium coffeatum]|uniref:Uncharacterized protein n=1 Tax=Fusarium coffeatum TaxID=231269 RepID=A0A366SB26_9HYPO|nr:uncharacterized protein FIESC28_00654 [Fusarium coffeatum]RBR26537.1 hypothetical protein FIESC28_00654 [Fusarium coffeatum]